ncbi:sugar transferase [Devosia crocina]|nr:sugar transferase [Devosia crocina]
MPAKTWVRQVQLGLKRLFDMFAATLALIVLLPLMLSVGALIRIGDGGPVLFRQKRVGQGGRVFEALKFRSMHAAAGDPSGMIEAVVNDGRVTPLGRFLRRSGIDELPQLWNILIGDMSLVGPRPHVPGMRAAGVVYEDLVHGYAFRTSMRPGLTGWAQCHGLRGSTVDRHKSIARIAHDFAYIQNFSLLLDMKILAITARREFFKFSE